MPQLRVVEKWIWHHRVLSILMLVGMLLLIKPVSFEVTHFNALDCGALITTGGPSAYDQSNETVGKQEIRCFVHAHQQCAAATLSITYQNVEGAGDVTFRTANNIGRCILSEIAYERGFCTIPPVCALVPYIDADCTAMLQQQDGLHFLDCGNVDDSVFRI